MNVEKVRQMELAVITSGTWKELNEKVTLLGLASVQDLNQMKNILTEDFKATLEDDITYQTPLHRNNVNFQVTRCVSCGLFPAREVTLCCGKQIGLNCRAKCDEKCVVCHKVFKGSLSIMKTHTPSTYPADLFPKVVPNSAAGNRLPVPQRRAAFGRPVKIWMEEEIHEEAKLLKFASAPVPAIAMELLLERLEYPHQHCAVDQRHSYLVQHRLAHQNKISGYLSILGCKGNCNKCIKKAVVILYSCAHMACQLCLDLRDGYCPTCQEPYLAKVHLA